MDLRPLATLASIFGAAQLVFLFGAVEVTNVLMVLESVMANIVLIHLYELQEVKRFNNNLEVLETIFVLGA